MVVVDAIGMSEGVWWAEYGLDLTSGLPGKGCHVSWLQTLQTKRYDWKESKDGRGRI